MLEVVQQYSQVNSMQYDFDSMQYDFDFMSLNFDYHCDALESNFLDHTSFDVAKTSSSRTTDMTSDMNLNERCINIYAIVSFESTSIVYVIDEGESTTVREHFFYQTDCIEESFYICLVVNCSHQSEKLKCHFE